jgi:hypothetical protein
MFGLEALPPTTQGLGSAEHYAASVAVVTRLAKVPVTGFTVSKISAKSGVVISSENVRIIYYAPNDIGFVACPKLLKFCFLESFVDRI